MSGMSNAKVTSQMRHPIVRFHSIVTKYMSSPLSSLRFYRMDPIMKYKATPNR